MKKALESLKGVTPGHKNVWRYLTGFCVASALWSLFVQAHEASLLFLAVAAVLTALIGMTRVDLDT